MKILQSWMTYRKGEGEMMWEVILLITALGLGALIAAAASGMLGNSGITAMIMSPLSELTAGAI
jgi:hypothetical protein